MIESRKYEYQMAEQPNDHFFLSNPCLNFIVKSNVWQSEDKVRIFFFKLVNLIVCNEINSHLKINHSKLFDQSVTLRITTAAVIINVQNFPSF